MLSDRPIYSAVFSEFCLQCPKGFEIHFHEYLLI